MLTLYHAQWSRSSSILWLLEELGAPYRLELVDIRDPAAVPESYRDIQPNKKVPAIDHDGTIVTERSAITLYLADAFPEAGLAPPVGDRARAEYLVWTVYCDSVFDPVVTAHARGLDYASNDYSFGLFDDMMRNLERKLTRDRYAAGDRFTAADTQLASTINFTMNIVSVLPEKPVFGDYLARIGERPAWRRSMEKDAGLGMVSPQS